MSKLLINENWLASLGDKIREKTGTTELISVGADGVGMVSAIQNVPGSEGVYAWKKINYLPVLRANSDFTIVRASNSYSSKSVYCASILPKWNPSTSSWSLGNDREYYSFKNSDNISDDILTNFKGKYVMIGSGTSSTYSGGWFLCKEITKQVSSTPTYDYTYTLVPTYTYESDLVEIENLGYIVSDNETEYPDGGTHTDGYYYEMVKSLISFTINGTAYQAKAGMTWDDWVLTDDNQSNLALYVDETGHITDGRNTVSKYDISYGSSEVTYDEEIEDGWDYLLYNPAE